MEERRLDFLTAEPVSGEILAERLLRAPLAPQDALRLAIEIGTALGRAHMQGKVHGNLCPSAIMFSAEGARLVSPSSAADRAAYRSPEEISGETADARSDIFAYGALLYELAEGRRAFPGGGPDLIQSILSESPAALTGDDPAYAAMQRVISGCLEKDPVRRRQRVQNAVAELRLGRRSLRRAESRPASQPLLPTIDPVPNPRDICSVVPASGWGWLSRRVWWMAAGGLALAATSIAAFFLTRSLRLRL